MAIPQRTRSTRRGALPDTNTSQLPTPKKVPVLTNDAFTLLPSSRNEIFSPLKPPASPSRLPVLGVSRASSILRKDGPRLRRPKPPADSSVESSAADEPEAPNGAQAVGGEGYGETCAEADIVPSTAPKPKAQAKVDDDDVKTTEIGLKEEGGEMTTRRVLRSSQARASDTAEQASTKEHTSKAGTEASKKRGSTSVQREPPSGRLHSRVSSQDSRPKSSGSSAEGISRPGTSTGQKLSRASSIKREASNAQRNNRRSVLGSTTNNSEASDGQTKLGRQGSRRSVVNVQSKPHFSTYQQHYSPRKPALAPVTAPSPRKVLEEKIPLSVQRDQMELLQLCLTHNQGCAALSSWKASAHAYFERSFEELASKELRLRQAKSHAQQHINLLAIQEWTKPSPKDPAGDGRLERLAQILNELSKLTHRQGKYTTTIEAFTKWLDSIEQVRTLNKQGSAQEFSKLGSGWIEAVESLSHKAATMMRWLGALGDAKAGSTLSRVLELLDAQVQKMYDELGVMAQIERDLVEAEAERVRLEIEAELGKPVAEGGRSRKGVWKLM
ncbi:MAG: hypothetical protein M1814_002352 [Vezdaea aestivalis]|nr:MAG: hypothetical protein M1814_002352 [Vezdaea aestivalis]